MFKSIHCAALYTEDIEKSKAFYGKLGVQPAWEVKRPLEGGQEWTLTGLKFPDGGAQLVLQNNPQLKEIDIEVQVESVSLVYQLLSQDPEVKWIQTPFQVEDGNVAVMQAPDGNVLVLVGP
ncbi:VOC family protein [Paenibacillus sp. UMB4589-SE434]|uniref:VOC family protein n=1 Tax=Paenibacillus sp. UMB4589-SE434 TaxID=3046314 RepID=UPI00254B4DFA|nr:VOC family protein [Paenibacillus sp. UMB4589-SE434]MDK8180574.1 VOC family protein [Paenibacillus sp. UMB4589-SE434]